MQKARTKARKSEPEMRAEYDFRGGVRGKYAARLARGANMVVLEPDVAERFPDANSVNEALRALATVADRTTRQASNRPKPKKPQTAAKKKPVPGSVVMVYKAGVKGRVPMKVAIASPEETLPQNGASHV